MVAGEGTHKEAAAIKALLACTDAVLVEKLQAAFSEHGVIVVPYDSFIARKHAHLIDSGFSQVQREDGETVLRKVLPVCDMPYAREHMVNGVHIFDSDIAVIDVTMMGMVTLVIGEGDDAYAEPSVDAGTPEGFGILVDARLTEPFERPMISLVEGLRTRLDALDLKKPSPFPEPRKKFPRLR